MTAILSARDRMRFASVRRSAQVTAQGRLLLVLAMFGLAAFGIIGKLAYFAVTGAPAEAKPAFVGHVPPRADIVDRNGVPMARTVHAYAVRIVPKNLIGDRRELAAGLARIFPDMSEATILDKLESPRPVDLRNRARPDQARAVYDLGEPGLEVPEVNERFYPQNESAAHVLGRVDADGKGSIGMERVLDSRLTDPVLRAQPAALSIDMRVQSAMEIALSRAMKRNNAAGAAGVVLDVETGEIIALASLPDFNPNFIRAEDVDNTRNRVTYDRYELGSTFKPLTVAAAMDAGVITSLSKRYDATEPYPVDRFLIKDDHPQRRWLNIPEMLVHSSNIVTARISEQMGRERMQKWMRSVGFDRKPGIELYEVNDPLWPATWSNARTATTGYGHGISVSPLHLASAYAALVNGGIYRDATLLKVEPGHAAKGRRVFTAATSARMRKLLRLIVTHGTGKNADAPGFRIGGKTGSAEKAKAGGYSKTLLISTFAAAFPMDKPRFVVIAMLDEPSGNAEGGFSRTAGATAAPVIKELVPRIGPMLGVMPAANRDIDTSDLVPLLWVAPGAAKEE